MPSKTTIKGLDRKRKPAGEPTVVWAEAGSIEPNPNNWRIHPERQRDALTASLRTLGWLVPVTFNATTGRLLDGHLRLEVIPADAIVPVWVVELDEQREAAALAVLDPIGAMAEADAEAFARVAAAVGDLAGELGEAIAELLGAAEAAAVVDGDRHPNAKGDGDPPAEAGSADGEEASGGEARDVFRVVAYAADEQALRAAHDALVADGHDVAVTAM